MRSSYLPIVVAGFITGACDTAQRPAADARARDEYAVQFDSTIGSDSIRLRAALVALGDSLRLTHFEAVVNSFGTSPQRFFAFLIPPPTYGGGNVHFALLATNRSDFGVRSLFDTGVPFGPVGVAIQGIADFDADGLPDIYFCDYRRAAGEAPLARIVGYRGDAWYTIETSRIGAVAACRDPQRQ
jgi:hypothetical protein